MAGMFGLTSAQSDHLWHFLRKILCLLVMGGSSIVLAVVGAGSIVDSFYVDSAPLPSPLRDESGRWAITDFSPMGQLNPHQFRQFTCIIMWLTVVFTGLGSEILVGSVAIVRSGMPNDEGWSNRALGHFWCMAQFAFPMLGVVSLQLAGTHNALSLPVVAMNLWKLGCPETIGYVGRAIAGRRRVLSRVGDMLNGFGTLSHHSSAALLVCALNAGLAPMTKPIVSCVLPLIVQHFLVPVKYWSRVAYIISELLVEAWFESEVFSNFEHFYGEHMDVLVRRAAIAMISAHWMYLLGGLVGLIDNQPQAEADAPRRVQPQQPTTDTRTSSQPGEFVPSREWTIEAWTDTFMFPIPRSGSHAESRAAVLAQTDVERRELETSNEFEVVRTSTSHAEVAQRALRGLCNLVGLVECEVSTLQLAVRRRFSSRSTATSISDSKSRDESRVAHTNSEGEEFESSTESEV